MWGQPCPCCWRCGALGCFHFLAICTQKEPLPGPRLPGACVIPAKCPLPEKSCPMAGWLPGRYVLSYTHAWEGGRRCLSQLGFVGLESMCVIIQQMGLVNRCWRQLCFLTQAHCLPGKEPARLCRGKYRAWAGCGWVSSSSTSFLSESCCCDPCAGVGCTM